MAIWTRRSLKVFSFTFTRSLAALEIFQKKPSNAVQKYFMWRVGSCEKRFSQEDSHIFGLRRTRQISGLATCYIDKLLELSPKVTVVSDTSEPSSSVNLWLAASMHGVEGEPFPEGSVCWVRDSAVMTEKEDLSSVKKKDIPGASKGLHSARLLVLGHGRSKSRLREKQIQALEERNSTRLKSELAEFESEAGRLRIELEDSRAALRTAQLERRSKEEQHESRISALTGLMHEEVNKAHERLTVTEMATTAAQRTLQLVEDEEAGKTSKSADELNRMKDRDYVRAESEAFDKCEFKLESIEKREKTRSLFENVQVEFLHKEKRTNDELREATLLRNEAAQAADEALALRIRLAREDQDLTSRQASLSTAEQQASQKLELAAVELDRARILTQELTKDKAEAFSELAEARRVSGRAQQERELAHQQSLEAEMAAFEAMKACEAADEDRKKVEQALLSVTEDLEKAARQQREGLELAAKGESSLHRMHMIEEKVSQYSEENQRLSQVLATERAACNEIRSEKERMQLELRDLTRLTRFASPRMRGQSGAAAQRIGSWAQELQKRTVPCLAEQQEVERCYAAPPGGDQLRCGPVVDAYVLPELHK
eukprot:g18892.t1